LARVVVDHAVVFFVEDAVAIIVLAGVADAVADHRVAQKHDDVHVELVRVARREAAHRQEIEGVAAEDGVGVHVTVVGAGGGPLVDVHRQGEVALYACRRSFRQGTSRVPASRPRSADNTTTLSAERE
jgi:hypothetical protein